VDNDVDCLHREPQRGTLRNLEPIDVEVGVDDPPAGLAHEVLMRFVADIDTSAGVVKVNEVQLAELLDVMHHLVHGPQGHRRHRLTCCVVHGAHGRVPVLGAEQGEHVIELRVTRMALRRERSVTSATDCM
jgi:hypothetical protein